jgi:hypothetical protein
MFYGAVIFKVYDIDGKGKVTFKDLVEVLRDLTGSSMSEQQREVLISYIPVFHCVVHSLESTLIKTTTADMSVYLFLLILKIIGMLPL